MDDFRDQVKRSFQACKNDIDTLNTKLESLESENVSLKDEILELKSLISSLNENLKGNINSEIKTDSKPKNTIRNDVQVSKDPYEALLSFKARANKKDILKQKMISMVADNGTNLSELKFLFVEHFKYCSKATFYNYLKELEFERMIIIERSNSKNIVYIPTLRKET